MNGIIDVDIEGYGTIRVHAKDLDWGIEHFLPASPAVLASLYEEWTGAVGTREEQLTVSELVIMLTAQARGQAEQEDELVPYYEVARISQLCYTLALDPKPHWQFVLARGFNHDGQAVSIKPPDSCLKLIHQSPASHLIKAWPDIKDQVPQGFVRNVLNLEQP